MITKISKENEDEGKKQQQQQRTRKYLIISWHPITYISTGSNLS